MRNMYVTEVEGMIAEAKKMHKNINGTKDCMYCAGDSGEAPQMMSIAAGLLQQAIRAMEAAATAELKAPGV